MLFFAQKQVAGELRLEANRVVPLKRPAMPDTARPRRSRTGSELSRFGPPNPCGRSPVAALRGETSARARTDAAHRRRRLEAAGTGSGRGEAVQIFILAGGLSSRMGRDKARLRLGGRALLTWVRAAAQATGWPVRVVWRDAGPRCGPLGGVWTAFHRSRARRLVFLSCDQPFVTTDLIRQAGRAKGPVFTRTAEGAGFPFALDRNAKPAVAQALAEKRYSLQAFAERVRAKGLRPAKRFPEQLLNLNTPAEFEAARCWMKGR